MNNASIRTIVFAGALSAAALFSGCSHRATLPVYDSQQTGSPIIVQKGRVVAVRDVVIKAPSVRAGSPGAGAQIGAGAVSSVITGSPLPVAAAAGRVVGGQIGSTMDDKMGEEITVEVEGGQRIIIVQERGNPPFAPDEPVEIHTSTGGAAGRMAAIYGSTAGNARIVRPAQLASETVAANYPLGRAR